jgi:hypothetical protein
MKLYAYCLVEDPDAFDASTRGISGATVRLLQIDELAVLVTDFNADTIAVTRENALDHAAVVRSVLDRTTPLPFRFGTLVTEQQLRNYISARKPALQTRFAHVRGCVEMSVKVIRELSDGMRSRPELHFWKRSEEKSWAASKRLPKQGKSKPGCTSRLAG